MRKQLFISLYLAFISFAGSTQDVAKPLSFKEKFIQLPYDVELAYVEQGIPTGTPVILLHGITDSWHSFESVLPYLPESLHAFALTQRGHGHSFKPNKQYALKDFAADVAAFIQAKQLGPVVVVGHSLGGVIAQQFVLDYPDLTRALVIVDSDASFRDNQGMPEFVQEVMRLTDPVDYHLADNFQKSTLAKPIDTTYYLRLVAESLKVPAHVWKEAFQELMEVDYTSQLAAIKKPTLIFWGDKDSFCLWPDQEALHKNITGSILKTYKGTGHALHWEEPERFATDLVSFINNL